ATQPQQGQPFGNLTLLDYSTYMTQLIGSESCNPTPSPFGAEPSAGTGPGGCSAEGQSAWVNSLVGRIFWDFLREKYWTDQVAHKIQKKLSKIKLPYFMNELTLADLDMGTCLPQVLSTSKPTLDSRGTALALICQSSAFFLSYYTAGAVTDNSAGSAQISLSPALSSGRDLISFITGLVVPALKAFHCLLLKRLAILLALTKLNQ
uniref:SMP-LTD domain-containing protein n=1 Tax=Stegastes partitus TaxID=144197 RepID=A0A3B5A1D4_9TELE